MNLPYSLRLACLCLEMVFLINLTGCALATALTGTVAKACARMRAQQAARWFLCLRLLPFPLALVLTAVLCVPSYLRYEQNTGSEDLGLVCMAGALLGLGLVITSAVRCGLALREWLRLTDATRDSASLRVAGTPVCVVEDGAGLPPMALIGVLNPRLVISRRLLQSLTGPQLEAALWHESAHRTSKDNLKRLLMAVMPGMFPGPVRWSVGLMAVESQWARLVELAADDHAAGGCAEHGLALAETLVKVARLGRCALPMSLASSLAPADAQLALRVGRLLSVDSIPASKQTRGAVAWRYAVGGLSFVGVVAVLPQLLHPLYGVMESLLH